MLIALCLSASPALAHQGGPEWSQFQGGPGHPGYLGDGPAPPYKVRWTFPAPEGESLSGAVIVDGVAITIGQEAVYGVDVATGGQLWRLARSGGPVFVPAVGTVGTELVLVFAESAEDASTLVGVTLAGRSEPSERWRTSLEATSRSGVTIEGDAVFVGDQDGTVYAVSLDDGTVGWTQEAGGRVDIPTAVSDGNVYVVARDADERRVVLSAFDLDDGTRRWRETSAVTSSASSAPAAVDGSVIVGSADRLVRSFGAEDGEARWHALALSLFSPVTSPAYQPGSAYLVDLSGGLYRFDAIDGGRDWGFQFNELVLRSSPVVSGAVVLLGLNDGRLVAVDVASGRLVWQNEATPGLIGTIALSHDAVVAVKGGRDAGLIAFEHDPEGRLVDVASPTTLDLGTTMSRMAVALAIVFGAIVLPGVLARRRFGLVTLAPDEDHDDEDHDDEEEEEP